MNRYYESDKVYNPKEGTLNWNARVLEAGETGWIGAYLKLDDKVPVEACINAKELGWNEICTEPKIVRK